MKYPILPIVLLLAVLPTAQAANKQGPMCASIREFVASVKPGQIKHLEFHTSWGSGFKGAPVQTIYAKRCFNYGYEPANAVCHYLMGHGAIEFSGQNAMSALACLSPGTQFGPDMQLQQLNVEFSYGTEQHSSLVTIRYGEDTKIGGMVLSITADGY